MSQTLGDDSEVVFDQPEERAGALEPDGSIPNRRKEEEWLEATEPYRGARPRTTEFDRPVEEGLGATSGGLEEDVKLGDVWFQGCGRNSKFGKRRRYRHHREGNHAGARVTNRGVRGL